MARSILDIHHFRPGHAWAACDIAEICGATVRIHWTDEPYKWHVNDGVEVFAVLDGKVEMRLRCDGTESKVMLGVGDVFIADAGDEHAAHPVGEARVLVIERNGSV